MLPDRSAARPSRVRPAVLVALVFAAALARLLPHPPNVAPIGAMGLFGGAYFASRWAAVGVPLAAMLVSDTLFELTRGWGFSPLTVVIYACLAASVGFGGRLRGSVRASSVAAQSLLSALLFFFVVNFAFWAGGELYPRTAEGLLACYLAAVPFLGNTLVGYALYGVLLFGGFELLQRRVDLLAPAAAAVPAVARARRADRAV